MYGVVVYYLSKLVFEIHTLFLMPLYELVIVFWGIGYRHGSFGEYYLVTLLTV